MDILGLSDRMWCVLSSVSFFCIRLNSFYEGIVAFMVVMTWFVVIPAAQSDLDNDSTAPPSSPAPAVTYVRRKY